MTTTEMRAGDSVRRYSERDETWWLQDEHTLVVDVVRSAADERATLIYTRREPQ